MDYIHTVRSKMGHAPLILVVVIEVAEKDGKILSVRKMASTEWSLPGGFMEIGEIAEETMQREIREETGLQATATGLLGVYTNYPMQKYPNGDEAHVTHIVMTCNVAGEPVPDGDEIEEVQYVHPDQITKRHLELIQDYTSGRRGVIK